MKRRDDEELRQAMVEVRDFIHRLEKIDVRLGGSGGVNLPSAVRAAME